jgi:trans-aconitate 2-methyltransferase
MSQPQGDRWDPAQYDRFRRERMQPWIDLLAMVQPPTATSACVLDLGCGTGELTEQVAARFPSASVLGIDTSEAMLEKARARAHARLRFLQGDIAEVSDVSGYDLVLSNAALHWVPDHERLLPRLLAGLPHGAQIAVQMPKNMAHPSHSVAAALVNGRWADRAGPFEPNHALGAERYAELLHAHGFEEQQCFEKIYGHTCSRRRQTWWSG